MSCPVDCRAGWSPPGPLIMRGQPQRTSGWAADPARQPTDDGVNVLR
ncbi:hypothetical protein [Ornithinimicrobium kibberense]